MENPRLKGLTSHEVEESRKQHGFNEIQSPIRKRIIQLFLEVVKEPMFLLLLLCGYFPPLRED